MSYIILKPGNFSCVCHLVTVTIYNDQYLKIGIFTIYQLLNLLFKGEVYQSMKIHSLFTHSKSDGFVANKTFLELCSKTEKKERNAFFPLVFSFPTISRVLQC